MNGLKSKSKITVRQVMDVSYSVRSPQSGATAVEHAPMVGLVAPTVIVLAVGSFRQQLFPGFQAVTAGL